MNSVTVTSPKAQMEFVEASTPFIFGAQDATAGEPCVPEMLFVRRNDQRDYAAGWASISGHNETTQYFLGAKN